MAAVLTHCKREIMQAVWRFPLDDDFLEAYEHGIVLKFPNGISQQMFPRILTYAANYPEKEVFHFTTGTSYKLMIFRILLVCMKFLGHCPCPRCLIEKSNIDCLGTKQDRKQ